MQRLADTLHGYGRVVVTTREPGATPAGARIRSIVLDKPDDEDDAPLAPRAEALLYAADRAHHVATVITPALQRGAVVLSDRYIDSSLAYQGAGRTLPPEEVAWLSRWATGGLKPDLVVLLDIDPAIGLARAARRSHADRLEAESLAFHQRVRQAFRDLAAADPDRYLVVDATQPVDVIAFTVRDRIHRMLPPAPAVPSPATGSATPLAPTVEPGSWAAFDRAGADGSPIVVASADRRAAPRSRRSGAGTADRCPAARGLTGGDRGGYGRRGRRGGDRCGPAVALVDGGQPVAVTISGASTAAPAATGVWAALVGQAEAIETLSAASDAAAAIVRGDEPPPGAMTHAWLFTGPAGSGRSVAARAFAAASAVS